MQESKTSEKSPAERRMGRWSLALVIVWTLLGAVALVYFCGGMLSVLAIPMGIIVWTAVFVFTLRSPVNRMNRAGVPRAAAVSIAYIVLFAVVVVVVLLLIPAFSVGVQFESMVAGFSGYMESLSNFVNSLYRQYPAFFANPTVGQLIDSAIAGASSLGETAVSGLASGVISATAFTVNSIMCILFALVVAFWLLLEMPKLSGELGRLFGEGHREEIDFLSETFSRVLGGFIKGMLLQCSVIIVGCALCYQLIGVDNGIMLAIIVGACNILPVLGQWVALVIALVMCLFLDPITLLLVLIVTFVVQRVVYTFIYPKIMADSVNVHPVMIIICMMVGYAVGMYMSGLAGGFVGILIAIPLSAIIKAMFVYYFERKTGRVLEGEDGVFFKQLPANGDKDAPKAEAGSHKSPLRAKLKAGKEKREAAPAGADEDPKPSAEALE